MRAHHAQQGAASRRPGRTRRRHPPDAVRGIEDPDYYGAEVAPLLGDGVVYAGHRNAEELAVELGRASLFVFTPCWDEPFGLVAAEAMACGLPVAAFDMGAAREVVGDAGRFAPPGDVAALATAMREAMAIPRRPA
ncbi:glycosyltransferase [Sphingomonas sp. WKB10]|nr:glycosyltransferase [Sphingomonas sp. WKB10]